MGSFLFIYLPIFFIYILKRNFYKKLLLTISCIIPSLFFYAPLFSKNRTPSYPYITGDAFRAFADHIFDEEIQDLNIYNIKQGDIIFLKTDYLEKFFKEYHPNIPCSYILITHNSDIDIPNKYACYLNDNHLKYWFGQNVSDYKHPKLIPIPIGITNRYNLLGDPKTITLAISATKRLKNERSILSYLNINIDTHIKERQSVLDFFSNKPFCKTITGLIPLSKYLENISHSKFVISPRGNGLDCHRTWEALYLGAIPIIKESNMDEIFDELPVLIVHEWNCITEQFLIDSYKEIMSKQFDLSRLYIGYWFSMISSYKNKIKNQCYEP